MKIIYITMQFPVPSETFASLDVESLKSKGHSVSVCGMRTKHPRYESLMRERGHKEIKVLNFSISALFSSVIFLFRHPWISTSLLFWVVRYCWKTPKHLFKSLVLLPSALSIFNYIKKNDPDVVHLFWGHYPSMVGFLVKEFLPEVKLSMFLGAHDLMAKYPGSRILANEIEIVFTHSLSNLSILEDHGVEINKVLVVYRGTSTKSLKYKPKLEKFNNLSSPVFVCAGRLIEAKGVDTAIEIFSEIYKSNSCATMYIAGEGEALDALLALSRRLECKKAIKFLGHIQHDELISLMNNAHFFLMMTRYPSDRLPNVIKEAMLQACVVLSSASTGIEELISDGQSGFIIEDNHKDEAIERIVRCINSPEFSRKMGRAAELSIRKNFDVDRSMEIYVNRWQQ